MNFVQGQLCKNCNIFVLKNSTTHVCHTQSHMSPMDSPPTPSFIQKRSNTDTSLHDKTPADNVHKDDIAELIEVVETSRPLWNFKLPITERSETVKRNLWNHIFSHFNGKYSIHGMQKTWKYLKEKYTREKKIGPSGSEGNKKEWPHLQSLSFLDEVLVNAKRTTESFMMAELVDEETEPPKSKKKSSIADHMSAFLDELKESRPIPPIPIPPNQEDDDDKFCSYLATLMRDIPKHKKKKLQGKMIAMAINESED